MSIEITRTSSGFSIRFPFELKDQFRQSFPSAKWDRDNKVWTVGPRSGKRLEQWAAVAESAAAEIDTRDERAMQEAELAELERELARVRDDIARQQKRQESAEVLAEAMDETRKALEAARVELAEQRAIADAEAAEADQAQQDAADILAAFVDLAAVQRAQGIMSRNARQVGAQAREAYHDAQAIIRRERDKLTAAGLRSRGLSMLVGANFNRPDRDDPGAVTMTHILTISKIED